MIVSPSEDLRSCLQAKMPEGTAVCFNQLEKFGFFILRNAIPDALVNKYYNIYQRDLGTDSLKKDSYHITKVEIGDENPLREIVKEKEILNVTKNFFNGNVGCDWIRVVKKDSSNNKAVFLHQDTGYQIGGFERFSFFTALSTCTSKNGSLNLWPGTHHLGYLGDAGELNKCLPVDFPTVCPDLMPGDILVMHSALWHDSPPNVDGTERIYLEFHIQHINEPTTRYEMHGKRTNPWRFSISEKQLPDALFKSSRVQRIKSMGEIIEKQSEKHTAAA